MDTNNFQFVIFRLENHFYAVPLEEVESVLPMVAMEPIPEAGPWTLGLINVHGTIMPVIDIRQLFEFSKKELSKDDHLLVIKGASKKFAIKVDQVTGISEFSKNEMEEPHELIEENAPFIQGAIRTEDGMIIVLDINLLYSILKEKGHLVQ